MSYYCISLSALCSDCDKKFAVNGDLKLHIKEAHEGKKHSNLDLKKQLETTLQLFMKEKKVVKEKKVMKLAYTWLVCNTNFITSKRLVGHFETVHEGKIAFSCKIYP